MKIIESPDSVDWLDAPLHYPWEAHRGYTKAVVMDRHGVDATWRCSCGAFGPPPWFFMSSDKPRYRQASWWQRMVHRVSPW